MTITPSIWTPVTPGVPGATTGADASDPSAESSGLFAQLMAALVPHTPTVPTSDAQPIQDQAQDQAQDPTQDPAQDPAQQALVPAATGLVPTSVHPSPLQAAGLPTAPLPGRKAGLTGATPTTDSGVAETPTAATAQPTTPPTVAPTSPGPVLGNDRHGATAPAAPAVSTTAPTTVPTAATPTVAVAEPTASSHHQKAGTEPMAPEVAPAPGPSNPAAPTAVPTTTSTTNQPAPAASPPLPVSRQVIPELTRMSTLGEGVHRLTMTLRPEALGEVRVTMTVRDGSLHVRLAAGTEAQHALVPDLTELQQVLKLGSGNDVRVVLRDLSGIPANPDQQSNQTGNQAGGQQGGGHHGALTGQGSPTGGDAGTTAGSGHQNRREAGTPRDINATDGVVDGTSGSRSQTVRRARPTGVDLTM